MKPLLSCIIIEDEPLATRRLQSLIGKQKHLFFAGNIDDIEEVNHLTFDHKNTDIVFLDLQIKGGNIVMLKKYLMSIPFIIVTSALFPEHYPSFIKEREHFILQKPISSIRFDDCLQMILEKNSVREHV
ncbi:hypothetical protein [Sphingobacterium sp. UBA6320]|uniref:hypothetical protein n=1 Tax=Sphingobacterium sp. UBA6320 TaxID=1947510 RepID=UPI0025D99036|nr:hypothetical protein [Sphingobacterium sp. UBA6320]